MTLFKRVITASIITPDGTILIENLRMAFNIKKTVNWGTNTCILSVWNLSPSKRSALRTFGDRVSIFAGYELDSGTGLLFVGNTTQTSHRFDQPEIISSLECGDGERNLNTILIELSYDANISCKQIVQDIADKMGVKITQFAPVNDVILQKGWSYAGIAKNGLDDVCNALQVQWSIQNEDLIILAVNGVSMKQPHQININTGMLGIPQQFTYRSKYLPGAARLIGWRVRTLLRPEILPGDEVRIQSNKVNYNLDGSFKVISIIHNGDTHGNSWDSTIEVIPVVRA